AILMDYYGLCLGCHNKINFKPRIAVNFCEGAEHFIHLYGMAMGKHYDSSPQCRGKVEKLAHYDDPRTRRRIEDVLSKITDEDFRRWEGRLQHKEGENMTKNNEEKTQRRDGGRHN